MQIKESPPDTPQAMQRPGQVSPVGFIGLGAMGGPMAHWLVNKGWSLHVYARRDEAAMPLGVRGALRAATPSAMGRACKLVMLCLSDDAAVEHVLFGPDGLAAGLAPSSIVVDMSTIAAGSARLFAERLGRSHVDYLDAPVSGGQQGAEAGTLACMIGGPVASIDAVRATLSAFCRSVTHVGDVGAGQTIKACNQIAAACALLGVAEAMVLARSQGISPTTMREVLLGGTARSFVLDKDGQRLIEQAFEPGFRARLMRKDLRIALDMVRRQAELQAVTLAERWLGEICDSGGSDLDWSAMGRLIQERAGSVGKPISKQASSASSVASSGS